jgi:hypothetical protein
MAGPPFTHTGAIATPGNSGLLGSAWGCRCTKDASAPGGYRIEAGASNIAFVLAGGTGVVLIELSTPVDPRTVHPLAWAHVAVGGGPAPFQLFNVYPLAIDVSFLSADLANRVWVVEFVGTDFDPPPVVMTPFDPDGFTFTGILWNQG